MSGTGVPALTALRVYQERFGSENVFVIFEKHTIKKSLAVIFRIFKKNGMTTTLSFILLQLYLRLAHIKGKPEFAGPCKTVSNINSPIVIDTLARLNPSAVIANACSIIKTDTLAHISKYQLINVHNGITPRYRGTGNIWALLERNYGMVGVTVHELDEGIDTGRIISNKRISLHTPFELDKIAFEEGANLACDFLISGKTIREVDTKDLVSRYYSYPALIDYIEACRIVCEKKVSGNCSNFQSLKIFNQHASNPSLPYLQRHCWTNAKTVKWHDDLVLGHLAALRENYSRVLDVGCGNARYEGQLPPRINYVGMDYSFNLLKLAVAHTSLVCSDSARAPFANGSFDTVISIGMLQHVFSSGQVLDELFRVTKKDGVLILNSLRDLSSLELFFLWPISLFFRDYHPLILERIRYKLFRPKKGARFQRYKVKYLRKQLTTLFKKNIQFQYNGVLGTRFFATEFVSKVA